MFHTVAYTLFILLIIIACIIASMHFIPGMNYRDMPVGLCEARLPENKPNWVSSLVSTSNEHYINPLAEKALKTYAMRMKQSASKIQITHIDEHHLIAYHQSHFFNFTDWICIKADGNVTSSATMGYSDFGKNREWVTNLRD